MEKPPPPFDMAAAKRRLQHRESSVGAVHHHPPRQLEGPRASTDHLLLTPDEIVMEGPYVRQHVDEAELEGLKQAILAGGEIKQAIGVRMEGTPLDPRYVLVYGMRRWLASRRAGLERIPVRNHGRIAAGESLTLQVAENEARVDPHPVDTAVSYQLLVQQGMNQAAIARIAGRSAAHISYMRAVGEAVLQLSSEERDALYEAPEATVPRFQKIAPLRTVAERVAALRALLDAGSPAARRDDPRPVTAFKAGPARGTNTWSVRVSYRDEELRHDPELAARLERFLAEQLARVREQIGTPNGVDAPRRAPVTWELE